MLENSIHLSNEDAESLDELIEQNNLQFVDHNVQETVDNDGINITLIFSREKSSS